MPQAETALDRVPWLTEPCRTCRVYEACNCYPGPHEHYKGQHKPTCPDCSGTGQRLRYESLSTLCPCPHRFPASGHCYYCGEHGRDVTGWPCRGCSLCRVTSAGRRVAAVTTDALLELLLDRGNILLIHDTDGYAVARVADAALDGGITLLEAAAAALEKAAPVEE